MDDKRLVTHRSSNVRELVKYNLKDRLLMLACKLPFYLPFIALSLLFIAPEAPISFNQNTVLLPQISLGIGKLNQYNNYTLLVLTWALTLYTFLAIKRKLWDAMLTLKVSTQALNTALYSGVLALVVNIFAFMPFTTFLDEESKIQSFVLQKNYDKAIAVANTTYKDVMQRNYVVGQIYQIQINENAPLIKGAEVLDVKKYLKENRALLSKKHWINIGMIEALAVKQSYRNIHITRFGIFSVLCLNLMIIIFLLYKKRVL